MQSHHMNPFDALAFSQENPMDESFTACSRNKNHRSDDVAWKSIKNQYGLTMERYHEILRRQKNLCAVCKESPKANRQNHARFVVDHCHETGIVRGLLCAQCNTMLGHAKDKIETLISGAKYLETFKAEWVL